MFLSQFVRFVQVNNLKLTLNRHVFTVHRFSSIIYKPDNFQRRTAEPIPMVSVLERVDCIPLLISALLLKVMVGGPWFNFL